MCCTPRMQISKGEAELPVDQRWQRLQELVKRWPPSLVPMDANARLGPRASPGVGTAPTPNGPEDDGNGRRLRQLLQDTDLHALSALGPLIRVAQRPSSS